MLDMRRALSNGKYPVKVRVRHRSAILISTGLEAALDEWSLTECKYRENNATNKARNVKIRNTLNIIDTCLLNLELEGRLASMSDRALKEILCSALGIGRRKLPNLVACLKAAGDGKSDRTRRLAEWTADKVEAYDAHVKAEDIDERWLQRFRDVLLQRLAPNSVALILRHISSACTLAQREGLIQANPVKGFKLPSAETRKRSLTVEQLRELRDMPLAGRYAFARDIFFFSFYLRGANMVDLYHLKPSDLRNGRIEYQRAKTGTLYSVLLEPEAAAIIERYSGGEDSLLDLQGYKTSGGMCSCVTRWLAKVMPGISTYYARHSWASIAAELDIPIETISHALGHKIGSPVTAIYVAYNQRKVDEANRQVIDYLHKGRRKARKK